MAGAQGVPMPGRERGHLLQLRLRERGQRARACGQPAPDRRTPRGGAQRSAGRGKHLAEAVGRLYRVARPRRRSRPTAPATCSTRARTDAWTASITRPPRPGCCSCSGARALRFHRVVEPARRTRLILQHFSAVIEGCRWPERFERLPPGQALAGCNCTEDGLVIGGRWTATTVRTTLRGRQLVRRQWRAGRRAAARGMAQWRWTECPVVGWKAGRGRDEGGGRHVRRVDSAVTALLLKRQGYQVTGCS